MIKPLAVIAISILNAFERTKESTIPTIAEQKPNVKRVA